MKKSKTFFLVQLVAFILSVSISQAVIVRQDVWDDPQRMEDVYSKARELTSVIEIIGEISFAGHGHTSSDRPTIASAVLIGPNIALTAAHSFVDLLKLETLLKAQNKTLNVLARVEDQYGNKKIIPIKSKYTHPNAIYNTPHYGLNDLVILELEEDVDTEIYTPSPLYRGKPEDLIGKRLHSAGYGYYGSSESDHPRKSDGRKRYFEMQYYAYEDAVDVAISGVPFGQQKIKTLVNYYRTKPITCNTPIQDASTSFKISEGMSEYHGRSTTGDSGGPVFNEDGEVVSIISWTNRIDTSTYFSKYYLVSENYDGCTHFDYDTPVSSPENLEWIDSIINKINNPEDTDTYLEKTDTYLEQIQYYESCAKVAVSTMASALTSYVLLRNLVPPHEGLPSNF